MASSLATTSSVTKATAVSHSNDANNKNRHLSNLSFARSLKPPNLRFLTSTVLRQSRISTVVKSQPKEVPADESANSTPPQEDSPSETLATEESISEFLGQVASLVKLVDSRDIVELKLKQYDCEVLIRKKEAIPQPQPPPPPPAVNYGFPPPYMSPPPSPAPPPPMPVSASPPMAASPASLPAAILSDPSLPSLKSPMAGTFYRSPAPGVPPFVKIGDKVQKGQVVCIVEAMKLMNEIEADQSGTIVEIIAEDGKPVSVNTPLLVIQP